VRQAPGLLPTLGMQAGEAPLGMQAGEAGGLTKPMS